MFMRVLTGLTGPAPQGGGAPALELSSRARQLVRRSLGEVGSFRATAGSRP
jgi:hypothetical protein